MRSLTEADLAEKEICEAFVDLEYGDAVSVVAGIPMF
jgi:hypothetical protein